MANKIGILMTIVVFATMAGMAFGQAMTSSTTANVPYACPGIGIGNCRPLPVIPLRISLSGGPYACPGIGIGNCRPLPVIPLRIGLSGGPYACPGIGIGNCRPLPVISL